MEGSETQVDQQGARERHQQELGRLQPSAACPSKFFTRHQTSSITLPSSVPTPSTGSRRICPVATPRLNHSFPDLSPRKNCRWMMLLNSRFIFMPLLRSIEIKLALSQPGSELKIITSACSRCMTSSLRIKRGMPCASSGC